MANEPSRFTQSARQLLSVSQELAEEFKSQLIEPEFLLLAMTHLERTVAFHILADFDIIRSKLQPYLEKTIFLEFIETFDPNLPHIDLADTTKTVLELSVDSARRQGLHLISTENLLIGLLRLKSNNMDKILAHFDVQRKDIIKLAEDYVIRENSSQKRKNEDNIDDIGCFAIIANTLGINKSKKNKE